MGGRGSKKRWKRGQAFANRQKLKERKEVEEEKTIECEKEFK